MLQKKFLSQKRLNYDNDVTFVFEHSGGYLLSPRPGQVITYL